MSKINLLVTFILGCSCIILVYAFSYNVKDISYTPKNKEKYKSYRLYGKSAGSYSLVAIYELQLFDKEF